MLGNMLNDLAEAIRRWTEKKWSPKAKMGPTADNFRPLGMWKFEPLWVQLGIGAT